jgi:hypothetical protein
LSLSNIRTPFLPIFDALTILLETLLFLGEVLVPVEDDHGGTLEGQTRYFELDKRAKRSARRCRGTIGVSNGQLYQGR